MEYSNHTDTNLKNLFLQYIHTITQTGNVVIIPVVIFVILFSTMFKFFLIARRMKFAYSLVFLNHGSIYDINHLFRMFGQELISTFFTTQYKNRRKIQNPTFDSTGQICFNKLTTSITSTPQPKPFD